MEPVGRGEAELRRVEGRLVGLLVEQQLAQHLDAVGPAVVIEVALGRPVAVDHVVFQHGAELVELEQCLQEHVVRDAGRASPVDGDLEDAAAPGVDPGQQPGHRYAEGGPLGPEPEGRREVEIVGRLVGERGEPGRHQRGHVPAALRPGQAGDLGEVGPGRSHHVVDQLLVPGEVVDQSVESIGGHRYNRSTGVSEVTDVTER
jgi:hypothetical protein